MQEDESRQNQLARELSGKLRDLAERCYYDAGMTPHAIATALLGTGVDLAARYLEPAQAAAWLRGVADQVEARGARLDTAGEA